MTDYDPDLDRAQQDRLGGPGGLVSIAYWIVRAISALLGVVSRRLRRAP